jgi:NAD(P)H-dependent FMN reductase
MQSRGPRRPSSRDVNQLRILGRWVRMITIPNPSSVAKAFVEFADAGHMKPSAFYERVVDVMEELMKFTLLTRDVAKAESDASSAIGPGRRPITLMPS